jgi:tetratricopeptide (TPR) repeat protein
MRQFFRLIVLPLAALAVSASFAQTANVSGPSAASASQKPKLPIKARTHEEYVAYQAAMANKGNADAMAKSAADFATRFPDSDIRLLLYRATMKAYRAAREPEPTMDAALKVLQLDKDDPEALLAVAEVQEEHTSPMDLDREQRMDAATANAQHALTTIDSDLVVPVGTAPEQIETYKKYLRSSALAILGTVQYKREKYPDAESTLRQALEADPANPDGVVVLRLALTLDQQQKYEDALQQANHAIELTKDDTDAGHLARTERDRLTALIAQKSATSGADPAPASVEGPQTQ